MFQVEPVRLMGSWTSKESGNLCSQCKQAAMGTLMMHKAYGAYAEECLTAVQREINTLEAKLSRFQSQSDISQINQAAGRACIAVSKDTITVLRASQKFSNDHPEYFRITIGPLMDLWRAASKTGLPPLEEEIQNCLPHVNDKDLLLEPEQGSAGLRRAGQVLDLGGIAKGYAANKILEIYNYFGVQSAYSNLGGNVTTLGIKPDGSPWKIGIQHPREEAGLIGLVTVENEAVVTSGDYQRYFLGRDGKRYHHILNPEIGVPTTSGLISVSIIAADAMTADALSTMVFIAGLEEGTELLRTYPQVNAILVDAELNVWITNGLISRFQKTDKVRMRTLNL